MYPVLTRKGSGSIGHNDEIVRVYLVLTRIGSGSIGHNDEIVTVYPV